MSDQLLDPSFPCIFGQGFKRNRVCRDQLLVDPGQPFFQRTMYTIRFMEQPDDVLPNWPGPEDPEGKAMLGEWASDTGSLAVYAWGFKEDGNALATQMIAAFGDAPVVTKDTLDGTLDTVQTARDSKARVQFIYKRWKGNYRPPLSLFRTGD